MEFLDGLSSCWWVSPKCIPKWEAWAVGAALLGGTGSWIAAVATYLAVIRPIKRRRLEDRAIATAAMEHFAGELVDLRDKMGVFSFSIRMLKPGVDSALHTTMVRRMTQTVAIPELRATPETLQLVSALNRLRRAVKRWNNAASTFDMEPDPELPSDFVKYEIDGLESSLGVLMNEIRAVARLIKEIVPIYAEDLDRILVPHDGFIVYPSPPETY